MSKRLKATIYVDEFVTSVAQARDYASRAEKNREKLKSSIWSLILATPKDIVRDGEDPIETLEERFDDIWDSLWDSFVDDYKYTVIADDAEFEENSLVKKEFDLSKKEHDELEKEYNEKNAFFDKYNGVLDRYNVDDILIYNDIRDGIIKLPSKFTKEDRDELVKQRKEKEKRIIDEKLSELDKSQC